MGYNVIRFYRYNKTAGYHRHIFRPPILLMMPFKRMSAFFSEKFSFLKLFWFFQENRIIKVQKRYLLIRILQKFCHLYRSWKKVKFFKKPNFFQKTISDIFEKSHYISQIAFYGKFAIILRLKIQIQNRPIIGRLQVSSELKKTHALSVWFTFHIINMGEY